MAMLDNCFDRIHMRMDRILGDTKLQPFTFAIFQMDHPVEISDRFVNLRPGIIHA